MKIRRFNTKDQGQVKELITDILANDFAMDQKAYPHSDLDSIPDVYGGEREVFFVGENEGRIIGTVAIKEESRDIAILRRLFIGSKYRGKGYGRLLIEKALDFCRDKGYHEVIFHVSDTMKAATALCSGKGFREKEKLNLGGVNIIKFALTI
jgi:putative acetyltransferase